MERKQVRKYGILAIYIAIWLIFRSFPSVTEHIYSKGIYPYIAKVLHFLLGWIPFSVGDILYTLVIIGLVITVLKTLDKIFSKSVRIVFAFFFLWGFNYFRIPLEDSLKISKQYSEEQLLKATQICINRANALHSRLAPNDSIKVDFWLSQKEIYRIATEGYPLTIQGISDFKAIKSVKPSIYSTLLTYMGYSGYL